MHRQQFYDAGPVKCALTSERSDAKPVWIEPGGIWAASWRVTAPMPAAGRQFSPVARQRMTNSNSRDVTRSSRSKNMPPRKGRKNRSMMASEKPSACSDLDASAL